MGRTRRPKPSDVDVDPDSVVEQPESDPDFEPELVSVEETIADTQAAKVAEHRRLRGQRPHGLHHQDHKTRK